MSVDPTDENEELFPDIEARAHDGKSRHDEADDESVELEKASKAARKLEPIVLAHVLGPKYQPVKPRIIAKQLKLPSEQHKALKLAIRRLAKAGKVNYGAGHLVRVPKGKDKSKTLTPALPQRERESRADNESRAGGEMQGRGPGRSRESKNVIVGSFRRTSKGFGFVRPQGAKRGDKTGDIYIAAGATMDASDRDIVRVRWGRIRPAAKGARCVRRARSSRSSSAKRTSSSASIRARRHGLCRGRWQSLRSGGARRRSRREGAAPDDKVVIEMVRFPTHQHAGEAVIIEVLGAAASRASIRCRSSANSVCRENFPTMCWKTPGCRPRHSTNRSAIGSI